MSGQLVELETAGWLSGRARGFGPPHSREVDLLGDMPMLGSRICPSGRYRISLLFISASRHNIMVSARVWLRDGLDDVPR